ncbi:DUF1542 domain-containing protein [Leuconostocaceae bacterium ESL0958]|nr:DUF1542 domain-containing protein [Leuconostocaceae bacterium ESL0958]
MEHKVHYKMYKDGKKWVFAGMTAISLMLAGSGATVKADENSNSTDPAQSTSTTDTDQLAVQKQQQQAQTWLQNQVAQAKQKLAAAQGVSAEQVAAFNKQADQIQADQQQAIQKTNTTTALDQLQQTVSQSLDQLVQQQQMQTALRAEVAQAKQNFAATQGVTAEQVTAFNKQADQFQTDQQGAIQQANTTALAQLQQSIRQHLDQLVQDQQAAAAKDNAAAKNQEQSKKTQTAQKETSATTGDQSAQNQQTSETSDQPSAKMASDDQSQSQTNQQQANTSNQEATNTTSDQAKLTDDQLKALMLGLQQSASQGDSEAADLMNRISLTDDLPSWAGQNGVVFKRYAAAAPTANDDRATQLKWNYGWEIPYLEGQTPAGRPDIQTIGGAPRAVFKDLTYNYYTGKYHLTVQLIVPTIDSGSGRQSYFDMAFSPSMAGKTSRPQLTTPKGEKATLTENGATYTTSFTPDNNLIGGVTTLDVDLDPVKITAGDYVTMMFSSDTNTLGWRPIFSLYRTLGYADFGVSFNTKLLTQLRPRILAGLQNTQYLKNSGQNQAYADAINKLTINDDFVNDLDNLKNQISSEDKLYQSEKDKVDNFKNSAKGQLDALKNLNSGQYNDILNQINGIASDGWNKIMAATSNDQFPNIEGDITSRLNDAIKHATSLNDQNGARADLEAYGKAKQAYAATLPDFDSKGLNLVQQGIQSQVNNWDTIIDGKDSADVPQALTDGKAAIDKVITDYQQAIQSARTQANTAITQARDAALTDIKSMGGLFDNRRDSANNNVNMLANNAFSDVTNSKDPDTINSLATTAVQNIQAADSQAGFWNKQDAAIREVQNYATAANNELIADSSDLSDGTDPQSLTMAISNINKTSKNHGIDQATTEDQINSTKLADLLAIDQQKAPVTLKAYANRAMDKINAMSSLTGAQVQDAQKQIDNAVTTYAGKMAKEQDTAGVDQDYTDGAKTIDQVVETAKQQDGSNKDAALTAAKAEIANAAQAAKDLINSLHDFTGEHKADALSKVDADAAQALKNVNGATSATAIKQAADAGKTQLDADGQAGLLQNNKDAATTALGNQASNANKDIDSWTPPLTEQEQSDAKAAVNKAASDAQKNVANQTDNDHVTYERSVGESNIQAALDAAKLRAGKNTGESQVSDAKASAIKIIDALKQIVAQASQKAQDNVDNASKEAINTIEDAKNQNDIDQAVTAAKAKLLNYQHQAELAAYGKEKNDLIQAMPNLSAPDKANAKTNIDNLVTQYQNKMDGESSQTAIDQDFTDGKTAIDGVVTAADNQNTAYKEAALKQATIDINGAADAARKLIAQQGNLTKDHRDALNKQVDLDQQAALAAINQSNNTVQNIQDDVTTWTNTLTQDGQRSLLRNAKDLAKENLANYESAAAQELQQQSQLNQNEQTIVAKQLADALSQAQNQVELAPDETTVTNEENAGKTNLHQLQRTNDLTADARTATASVNNLTSLTDDEKRSVRSQIGTALQNGQNDINGKTTVDDAESAYQAALKNIQSIQGQAEKDNAAHKADALNKATAAIEDAAKTARDAINGQSDYLDTHKQDALAKVEQDRVAALAAVNGADNQTAIEKDSDYWVGILRADQAAGLLQNYRDKAQTDLTQYQQAATNEINGQNQLTKDEKDAVNQQLANALQQAIQQVQVANDSQSVDNAQARGERNLHRLQRANDLTADARNAKQTIAGLSSLTDPEKQTANQQIDSILTNGQSNVNGAADATDAENQYQEAKQALAGVTTTATNNNNQHKQDALDAAVQAIQKAAKDARDTINGQNGYLGDHQQQFIDQINGDEQAGLQAVQADGNQFTINQDSSKWVGILQKDASAGLLQNTKDNNQTDLTQYEQDAANDIKAQSQLDETTQQAILNQLSQELQTAIGQIQAAQNSGDVATAFTNGQLHLHQIQRTNDLTADGAIAKQAVKALTSLTSKEQQDAADKIDAAVQTGQSNVDSAGDLDTAEQNYNNAKAAIDAIKAQADKDNAGHKSDALNKATTAIQNAAQTARNAINAQNGYRNDHQEQAIAQVNKDEQAGLAAIQQDTNQFDINSHNEYWVGVLQADQKAALLQNYQDRALTDLEQYEQDAVNDINAQSQLTTDEKSSINGRLTDVLNTAKGNVQAATDNNGVDGAGNAGKTAMHQLQRANDLTADSRNADNHIDSLTSLSTDEKKDLKGQVNTALTQGQTAINGTNSVDDAETAYQSAKQTIDGITGQADKTNNDHKAGALTDATKAIKDAAQAARDAINAKTGYLDNNKDTALAKVQTDEDAGLAAVQNDDNQYSIKSDSDHWVKVLQADQAAALLQNYKDNAKTSLDQYEQAAATEIDGQSQLSADEKSSIKGQLTDALNTAKGNVQSAANNGAVDTAVQNGQTSLHQLQRANDLTADSRNADAHIDSLTSLSTGEKSDLKGQVNTALTQGQTAINSTNSVDDAETAYNNAKNAIDGITGQADKNNNDHKAGALTDATKAIKDAAQAARDAINAKTGYLDNNKDTALAKVQTDEDAGLAAIQKDDNQYSIKSDSDKWVAILQADQTAGLLQNYKDNAKTSLSQYEQAAATEIDGQNQLSADEKSNIKGQLTAALNTAKGNVQSAANNGAVDTAVQNGQTSLHQLQRANDLTADSRNADAHIDSLTSLSPDEKNDLKGQVNTALTQGQTAINGTNSVDSAEQAYQSAKDAINAVTGQADKDNAGHKADALDKATTAIHNAAQTARDAINAKTGYLDDNQKQAINKVNADEQSGVDAVNAAGDQYSIKSASDYWVKVLQADQTAALLQNYKDNAKTSLAQYEQAAATEIDGQSQLSADEKSNIKGQLTDALNTAKGNVQSAANNGAVDTAVQNGQTSLHQLQRVNDLTADSRNADNHIDSLTSLSSDEKKDLKGQVNTALTQGQSAINGTNSVDDAETAYNNAKNTINAVTGQADKNNNDHKAGALTDATKAIKDAAQAARDAINAKTGYLDDNQKQAINKVNADEQSGVDAVNGDDNQFTIKSDSDKWVTILQADQAAALLQNYKDNAKTSLDQYEQAAATEIDSQSQLSADEKSNIKGQLTEALNTAKGNVQAATDNNGVDSAGNAGKTAMHQLQRANDLTADSRNADSHIDSLTSLSPDEKTQLKGQVNTALTQGQSAINGTNSVDDAEKAYNQAKDAINAITGQADKNNAGHKADALDKATTAIHNAAQAARDAINGKSGYLDDNQKQAINKVNADEQSGVGAVNAAGDQFTIKSNSDYWVGVLQADQAAGLLQNYKDNAKTSLDQYEQAAAAEIDGQNQLSADEKKTIKSQLTDALNTAKGNVQAAADNGAVDSAVQNGQKSLHQLQRANDLTADSRNADSHIDSLTSLSTDEKGKLKAQVNNALTAGQGNVNQADSTQTAEDAYLSAKQAIDAVTAQADKDNGGNKQAALDKATQDIQAAAETARNAINGQSDYLDNHKQAALDQIQKDEDAGLAAVKADDSQDSINSDRVKWVGILQADQAAGLLQNAKDQATTALQQKAQTADTTIDQLTPPLTSQQQTNYKNAIDQATSDALRNVQVQNDETHVASERDNGLQQIQKQLAAAQLQAGKNTATTDLTSARDQALKVIDALQTSVPDASAAAHQAAEQAAQKAIDQVNAANDQSSIDQTVTAGKVQIYAPQRQAQLNDYAKQKENAIQDMANLSADTKADFAKSIDGLVKTWSQTIGQDGDQQTIDNDYLKATQAIDGVYNDANGQNGNAKDAALAAAKKAIGKAAQDALNLINDQHNLTPEHRQAAIDQVNRHSEAALNAVNNAGTAADINKNSKAAVDQLNKDGQDAVLQDAKDAAANSISDRQKEAHDLINGMSNLSDDEKKQFNDAVDGDGDAAKKSIAGQSDADGVKNAKQSGLDKINQDIHDADLRNNKNSGKGQIDNSKQEAIAKINALRDKLGAVSQQAKDNIDKAATKAIQDIEAASDDDHVHTAVTDGEVAMWNVLRQAELAAYGKDITDQVNALPNLSDPDKQDAATAINNDVVKWQNKMQNDGSQTDIDHDFDSGKQAIDADLAAAQAKNGNYKTAAIAAAEAKISQAAQTARDNINQGHDYLDNHKNEALDKVTADENAAMAAVKNADTAAAVKTAGDQGATTLAADGQAGILQNAKDAATTALANQQSSDKQAIDQMSKLTADQKQSFQAAIDQAAKDATANVSAQSDPDHVNTEKNNGLQQMQKIMAEANLRNGKNDGQGQVSDAKQKAIDEINKLKDLIGTASDQSDDNVKKAAQDAINTIEGANDQPAIDQAVTAGKVKMLNFQRQAQLAADGQAKLKTIQALPNLFKQDITGYQDTINGLVTTWQNKMQDESTQDGIESDYQQGLAAIEAVLAKANSQNTGYQTAAKSAAEDAVKQAASDADQLIDQQHDFLADHQQAAKQIVADDLSTGLAAVDAANTVAEINKARDTWVSQLQADGQAARLQNAKDQAKTALQTAQQQADTTLTGLKSSLKSDELTAAQQAVQQAASDADSNVQVQNTVDHVTNERDNGLQKIAAALTAAQLRAAKNDGQQAVEQARNNAWQTIDSLKQSVPTDSDKAHQAADQTATQAIQNIENADGQPAIQQLVKTAQAEILASQRQAELADYGQRAHDKVAAMPNLKDADKTAAETGIQKAVSDWQNKIGQDNTTDTVNQDFTDGKAAIDAIYERADDQNGGYKAKAIRDQTKAIQDAAKAARQLISEQSALTETHRAGLNQQVNTDEGNGLAAVKAADTAEDATTIGQHWVSQLNQDGQDAVLRNAKDQAQDTLQQYEQEAAAEIDGQAALENDEKTAVKNELSKALTTAQSQVEQAQDATAVTVATNDGQKTMHQLQRANDLTADSRNADNHIDSLTSLSPDEKKDLKGQVNTALTQGQTAINGTDSADNAEKAYQSAKQAIDGITGQADKNNNDHKTGALTDATKAIKDTAQAVRDAINAQTGYLDDNQQAAIQKVNNDEKDGLAAVNAAGDQFTIKRDSDHWVGVLDADKAAALLQNYKDNVKTSLDQYEQAAATEIDGQNQLSADEKSSIKGQLTNAVNTAKGNVQAATDNNGVDNAANAGKTAMHQLQRVNDLTADSRNADSHIDSLTSLSPDEKTQLKGQVNTALTQGQSAINGTHSVDDAETAYNNAKNAIDGITGQADKNNNDHKAGALTDATKAIKDAAQAARAAINAKTGYLDNNQQTAINKVNADEKSGIDAVDGDDNQYSIKRDSDYWVGILQADQAAALLQNYKDNAKTSLDQYEQAAATEIDSQSQLSADEKSNIKGQLTAALNTAKNNVQTAADNGAVDTAVQNGQTNLHQLQRVNDLTADSRNADAHIDALTSLSTDEKKDLKGQVNTALTQGQTAINGTHSVDDAETAYNNAKKVIDGITGQADKNNAGHKADALDKATTAIHNAAQAARDAINAKTGYLDDNQKQAINKVNADEQSGVDAVNAAGDQFTIKSDSDYWVGVLDADKAAALLQNYKDNAKTSLDQYEQAAATEIDGQIQLSADEKSSIKSQLTDALNTAKRNVQAATDNNGVVSAANAGKTTMDQLQRVNDLTADSRNADSHIDSLTSLSPDEKKDLKGQVNTALTQGQAAINGTNSVDDAETAYNNAKNAIDGITGQADKNNNDHKAGALTDATKAIKDAAQAARDAINAKTGYLDNNQQTAINKVNADEKSGVDAVNSDDNQFTIKSDSDYWVGVLQADQAAGLLQNYKDNAKTSLDQYEQAAANEIDGQNQLSADEKSSIKGQLTDALNTAKRNVQAATDNNGVDSAANAGRNAMHQIQRTNDLTADGLLADGNIDTLTSLSPSERQDAKDRVQKTVTTGQQNIQTAGDEAAAEIAYQNAKNAIATIVSDENDKNGTGKSTALKNAIAAIQKASNENRALIGGQHDFVDNHQKEALDQVATDEGQAIQTVEAASDRFTIESETEKAVNKLNADGQAAVLRNNKDKAETALTNYEQAAAVEIDGQNQLSASEKQAIKSQLSDRLATAKQAIEAATDSTVITQQQANGEKNLHQLQRVNDLTADSRNADAHIDALTSLSTDEKKDLKGQVTNALTQGQTAINGTDSADNAEKAYSNAKNAIDGITGQADKDNAGHKADALDKATTAIHNAAQTARDAINAKTGYLDDNQKQAINKVNADEQSGVDAVNAAGDQFTIKRDSDYWVKVLQADQAAALLQNYKDNAKMSLSQYEQAAATEIDAQNQLSADEKSNIKGQLTAALNTAKGNVQAAADNGAVDTAVQNGQKTLHQLQRVNDLTVDSRNADSHIDSLTSLSTDEKNQLKGQITKALTQGQSAINGTDSADNAEKAYQSAKQTIDGITGQADKNNNDHKAGALTDATAAIKNAAQAARAAINAKTGYLDNNQQAAIQQVDDDEKDGLAAVHAAGDQFTIKRDSDYWVGILDADKAAALLQNYKDNAKTSLSQYGQAAADEIDGQNQLSADEKKTIKGQLADALNAAKNNVQTAANNGTVDTAVQNGQKTLHQLQRVDDLTADGRNAINHIDSLTSLSADEKAKLVGQVNATVRQGQTSINGTDSADNAEKAYQSAKQAIDAITGQADKDNGGNKQVALDKATQAIKDAAQAARDAINAKTGYLDNNQQAAINKVNADEKSGIDTVNGDDNQYSIKRDSDYWVGILQADQAAALLQNYKDNAKTSLGQYEQAAADEIDGQNQLSADEKKTIKGQLTAALNAAKNNVQTAANNNAVDHAVQNGQKTLHQLQRVNDLTADGRNVDQHIDALTSLTADEKQHLQQQVATAVTTGQGQINATANAADAETAYQQALAALSKIASQADQKNDQNKHQAADDAKKAIQNAADKAKNAINNLPNLTPEHKKDALKRVDDDAKKANDAVNGAKSADDAKKAAENGAGQLKHDTDDAILQDAKDRADRTIDDDLAKAIADVDQQGRLKPSEKVAVKAALNKAAQAAKDQIQAANEVSTVDQALATGEKNIDQGQRQADLTNDARAADDSIDQLDSLTAAEKQAGKDQIQQAAANGQQAINGAADKAAVEAAYQKAKDSLTAIVQAEQAANDRNKGNALNDAKKAIQNAADKAKEAINNLPNLTPEHKKDALKQVDDDAKKANDAVNGAKSADDIRKAAGQGEADIRHDQDNAHAQDGKDKADRDIDAALAKAIADIDQQAQLKPSEKVAVKAALRKAAMAAKQKINAAVDDQTVAHTVDQAMANGERNIHQGQRQGDLTNDARDAGDSIDHLDSLTAAEKQAAKDQINQADANGQQAIQAAPDKDGAEAAYQKAKDSLTAILQAAAAANDRNKSNALHDAKKAINDAANKAKDVINHLPNLTPEHKKDALKRIDDDAKKANDAVNGGQSADDIKKAAEDGAGQLKHDTDDAILQNAKDKASQTIDDDLAKAIADVEQQGRLKPSEKVAVKAALNKAAQAAKGQINAANDLSAVDQALATGEKDIDQGQRQADLTNDARDADNSVEQLDSLTAAEKQAGKDQINQAATNGQQAINGATDKAAVEAAYQKAKDSLTAIMQAAQAANDRHKGDALNDAKKAIQDAANKAKDIINNLPNLTPEHKKDALKQIDDDAKKANDALNGCQSADGIKKAAKDGAGQLKHDTDDAVLQDAKDKAQTALAQYLQQALADIDRQTKLRPSERLAVKSAMQKAARAASGQIDQASDQAAVTAALNQGETAIDKLQRKTDLANDGRETAAQIDVLQNLTAAEKQAAKDEINRIVQTGQAQIDGTDTVAAVEQAYANAKQQLTDFLTATIGKNGLSLQQSKAQAQQALRDYAKRAEAFLRTQTNHEPADIAAAIQAIEGLLNQGLTAIDQADSTAKVTQALQEAMHAIDQIVADLLAKKPMEPVERPQPVLPATHEQAKTNHWASLSLVTALASLFFYRNKKKDQ